MILRIIKNSISISDKIKRLIIYLYRRRGAKKSWRKRHDIVFRKHPKLKKKCDYNIEIKHSEIWADFDSRFSKDTLRICKNISGISSPKIVPEEIFQTDIEPSLNDKSYARFFEQKSFYNKWFRKGIFPKDYFHSIDGKLINYKYKPIDLEDVERISKEINYPVIFKSNFDTYGGRDVYIVNNSEKLIQLTNIKNNFVVQEKIDQHISLGKYHPKSLNTVRACLYKSVRDNEIHFLHSALRMGKDGSLDNVSAGGLVSFINDEGFLHGYALDKYGKKYYKHPNSNHQFNEIIPDYESLKLLAISIMQNIHLVRVASLDLCYDSYRNWRAIEINIMSNTIRFSQYAGVPFFRDFTDEVVTYTLNNHWTIDV